MRFNAKTLAALMGVLSALGALASALGWLPADFHGIDWIVGANAAGNAIYHASRSQDARPPPS